MAHEHQEYTEGCFACKVSTLSFGMVPGGYRARTSQTYYDSDALPDWPTKEEVMDARSDFRNTPEREMKIGPTGRLEEK